MKVYYKEIIFHTLGTIVYMWVFNYWSHGEEKCKHLIKLYSNINMVPKILIEKHISIRHNFLETSGKWEPSSNYTLVFVL